MKSLIVLAACVYLLHVSQCFASTGEASFDSGNYAVNWTYYPMYDKISVQVTVKTTGWVGFGFAKKAPNTMKDYDVVVAGVNATEGSGYLNDYYTSGRSRPPPDDMQNYNLTYAKEENGMTMVMFERKINTGDDKDVRLMEGEGYYIVWSYHKTDEGNDPKTFPQHSSSERGWSDKKIVFVPRNDSVMTTPTMTPSPSPSKANVIGGWALVNVVLALLLSFLYIHL